MAQGEPYWKLLWGEKAQRNVRAEWLRREERRKVGNMDCRPIKIMKVNSLLSKAYN
jgi:hypothetical protein